MFHRNTSVIGLVWGNIYMVSCRFSFGPIHWIENRDRLAQMSETLNWFRRISMISILKTWVNNLMRPLNSRKRVQTSEAICGGPYFSSFTFETIKWYSSWYHLFPCIANGSKPIYICDARDEHQLDDIEPCILGYQRFWFGYRDRWGSTPQCPSRPARPMTRLSSGFGRPVTTRTP